MRSGRIAWLVAALALAVPLGACGGGEQVEKRRDPAGRGETRRPDVDLDTLAALRRVEVAIEDGRFKPDQVSVRLDNTVVFVNRDDERHRVLKVRGPGEKVDSGPLAPGETFEYTLIHAGDVVVTLEDEPGAKMTIAAF